MVAPVGTVPPPIAAALEPGEHLIWWDRPKRGLVLRVQDFFLIPFSVVWAGAAWMAASTSLTKSVNPIFMAVSALFVAVALYITVGRFLHDIWRRSRLLYGLTDRRILIVSPSQVRSIDLQGVGEMNVKRSRGGYGSLSFGAEPANSGKGNLGAWAGVPIVPTFEFIQEPERVFQEIRRRREAARDVG